MATKKPKSEGIAAIMAKQDPVSIQELTMRDFFAAFALQGLLAHHGVKIAFSDEYERQRITEAAFDQADEMLERRGS